jgi:hypothetical protein
MLLVSVRLSNVFSILRYADFVPFQYCRSLCSLASPSSLLPTMQLKYSTGLVKFRTDTPLVMKHLLTISQYVSPLLPYERIPTEILFH